MNFALALMRKGKPNSTILLTLNKKLGRWLRLSVLNDAIAEKCEGQHFTDCMTQLSYS